MLQTLSSENTSPKKPGSNAKPSQIFDIDSLNEIKKANDLASKKVEITNQLFEMLVNEVKDNLFPIRDDEDGCGDEASGRRKRKQKRVQRRVKKPNVLPKIKEIRDGMPVDVCLKRIQVQAKLRQSMASGDLAASLSATT